MQIPESARDLISGAVNVEDYFAQMSEEQRFRGDARLLRKLLTPVPSDVTPRERDILKCAARGLRSRETATELGISFESERSMRKTLIRRLHARNMTHAVALWLECKEAQPTGVEGE